MYVRISETKSKDGKSYKYLRIEESYRDKWGRSKKRVLAILGRLDKICNKLDSIVLTLRKFCQKKYVLPDEVKAEGTPIWGPILIARALWEKVGLDKVIEQLTKKDNIEEDIKEKIFLLVANRLHEPTSEHGLARWLDKVYGCYRGDRIKPKWQDEDKITDKRRVRVKWEQLKKWYKAGDYVYSYKEKIQKYLYLRFRNLFSLSVDLIFYDTTSTYFEVMEKRGELRSHGYSRDEKRRNIQVVVGIAMADGFPICHHVFPGNKLDKNTAVEVIKDIEGRFGIRRLIFVGDRGMVSKDNIRFLEELHHKYIFGCTKRNNKNTKEYIRKLTTRWEKIDNNTRYQEIKVNANKRVFVVYSEQRRRYEEEINNWQIKKCREELEKLTKKASLLKTNKVKEIVSSALAIMQKYKGYRYFAYEVKEDGSFCYYEDKEKLSYERKTEGIYILETNDMQLSGYEVIGAYKNLSMVENFFKELKDNLGIRPNWHKTDPRISSHIFISYLALVLISVLIHLLKEKGIYLSASDSIRAVETIGIAELNFLGETHKIVSKGTRDARRVINALGIKDINP